MYQNLMKKSDNPIIKIVTSFNQTEYAIDKCNRAYLVAYSFFAYLYTQAYKTE